MDMLNVFTDHFNTTVYMYTNNKYCHCRYLEYSTTKSSDFYLRK